MCFELVARGHLLRPAVELRYALRKTTDSQQVRTTTEVSLLNCVANKLIPFFGKFSIKRRLKSNRLSRLRVAVVYMLLQIGFAEQGGGLAEGRLKRILDNIIFLHDAYVQIEAHLEMHFCVCVCCVCNVHLDACVKEMRCETVIQLLYNTI